MPSKSHSKSKALPQRGEAFVVPLAKGLFGACRVIRALTDQERRAGPWFKKKKPYIVVAATQWVGKQLPDLSHPHLRTILRKTFGNWATAPDQEQLELNWVSTHPPTTYKYLGVIEPTPEEENMEVNSFRDWGFELFILLQWQHEHDPEGYLAQVEERKRERERQQRPIAEESDKRLAGLTFKKLRKQRLFGSWAGSVSPRIIRASRKILYDTIDALAALGPTTASQRKRDLLRQCIERFNELDKENDHFISTIEREDICEHFYELVHLTGLESYSDSEMADEWRKW